MMNKKRKKFLVLVILVAILTIGTVYAAPYTATGNFSLTFGQWDRSAYATLQASYPYVRYKGQSSDSVTLRVTLSKKAYFGLGFENRQTVSRSLSGNNTEYAYFNSETTNKDYLITTVNQSNATANASFLLSSKSTYGQD